MRFLDLQGSAMSRWFLRRLTVFGAAQSGIAVARCLVQELNLPAVLAGVKTVRPIFKQCGCVHREHIKLRRTKSSAGREGVGHFEATWQQH